MNKTGILKVMCKGLQEFFTEDELLNFTERCPPAIDWLDAALQCDLLGTPKNKNAEFFGRLCSDIEEQFRSALAECQACYLMKRWSSWKSWRNKGNDCRADLLLTNESQLLYIEVKNYGIRSTLKIIREVNELGSSSSHGNGDPGVDCIEKAVRDCEKQLCQETPNILMMMPTMPIDSDRARVTYLLQLALFGRISSDQNTSGFNPIRNSVFCDKGSYPILSAVVIPFIDENKITLPAVMHNPWALHPLPANVFNTSWEYRFNADKKGYWWQYETDAT